MSPSSLNLCLDYIHDQGDIVDTLNGLDTNSYEKVFLKNLNLVMTLKEHPPPP